MDIIQRGRMYLVKVSKSIDDFSIVAVFVVHFLFVLIAIFSDKMSTESTVNIIGNHFKPYLALFKTYNSFFFMALLWSMQESTKPAPLQMAVVINLISIVLDMIVTAKRYDHIPWFMIVNIVLRPITSAVLLREVCQRKRSLSSLWHDDKISLDVAIKSLINNAPQSTNECELDLSKNTTLTKSNILNSVA